MKLRVTNSKGSDDYNLRLSLQRAQAVLQALQQRHSASQATAHGYGETRPVAPNEVDGTDSPSNRCQRQFKFDPFGYEFGNLNLTPHLLNITHAW